MLLSQTLVQGVPQSSMEDVIECLAWHREESDTSPVGAFRGVALLRQLDYDALPPVLHHFASTFLTES